MGKQLLDRWILTLVCLTAFTIPFDKFFEFPLSLEFCNLTSILCVGLISIRAWQTGIVKSPPRWMWAVAIWLALAVISSFDAENSASAIRRIISYLVLICTMVSVSQIHPQDRAKVLGWFAKGCIVMVITMLYMLKIGELGGDGRIAPPNQDPNEAATHLVIGILCSFWVYENSEPTKKSTWSVVGCVSSCLAGMLLSGSRGAVFSLIVIVLFIVFTMKRGRRVMAAATPILGVSAFLFIPPYLLDRVLNFAADAQSGKLSKRDLVWQVVLQRWGREPIWGIGPGNLAADVSNRNQSFFAFVAHNTFLEILAEHGIMGLTSFLCFMGLLVWRIVTAIRENSPVSDIALAAGGIAGMVLASLSLSMNNSELLWFVFGVAANLPLTQVTKPISTSQVLA